MSDARQRLKARGSGKPSICSSVMNASGEREGPRGDNPKIPRRTIRLGDVVLKIDRLRLVILGGLFQPLLFLGITGRLGLTLGTRGFIAKIIGGGIYL
jgi:hypothetical protein